MAIAITTMESIETSLQFALLLLDGFSVSENLLGTVNVTSGNVKGQRKDFSGAFLFYNLKNGPQVFTVRCGKDTPFYVIKDIALTIPMPAPQWPAFPDITLADPDLPLGDPRQSAAYRAQRLLATLQPTVTYPFPGGATLVRGTVWHAGKPLADAIVQQVGGNTPAYTTSEDGQFVLFFQDTPSVSQTRIINVKHQGLADVNVNTTITRGMTTSLRVNM